MTPEQAATAVKSILLDVGGAFGNDPKTMRRAREIGLTGWSFYVAGRGGALGDVRSDTVAAAMGFIAPGAVRDGWDAARGVFHPSDVAGVYLEACCSWGTETLAEFYGVNRLVDLGERIVIHAEAAGMPLFAAWRAMPIPDDAPGARAAVLLHLLREHRGAAHLIAARASGLTPIEAIIAGPDGIAGATAFGWPPPYPPVGALIRKRALVEALTDRIAGAVYRVLELPERQEFVQLVEDLDEHVAYVRGFAR